MLTGTYYQLPTTTEKGTRNIFYLYYYIQSDERLRGDVCCSCRNLPTGLAKFGLRLSELILMGLKAHTVLFPATREDPAMEA